MTDVVLQVLALLKNGELLSAKEIELRLGIVPEDRQKKVRSAIDRLRYRNEPIWNERRGFWWSDAYPLQPSGVADRWKRVYGRLGD